MGARGGAPASHDGRSQPAGGARVGRASSARRRARGSSSRALVAGEVARPSSASDRVAPPAARRASASAAVGRRWKLKRLYRRLTALRSRGGGSRPSGRRSRAAFETDDRARPPARARRFSAADRRQCAGKRAGRRERAAARSPRRLLTPTTTPTRARAWVARALALAAAPPTASARRGVSRCAAAADRAGARSSSACARPPSARGRARAEVAPRPREALALAARPPPGGVARLPRRRRSSSRCTRAGALPCARSRARASARAGGDGESARSATSARASRRAARFSVNVHGARGALARSRRAARATTECTVEMIRGWDLTAASAARGARVALDARERPARRRRGGRGGQVARAHALRAARSSRRATTHGTLVASDRGSYLRIDGLDVALRWRRAIFRSALTVEALSRSPRDAAPAASADSAGASAARRARGDARAVAHRARFAISRRRSRSPRLERASPPPRGRAFGGALDAAARARRSRRWHRRARAPSAVVRARRLRRAARDARALPREGPSFLRVRLASAFLETSERLAGCNSNVECVRRARSRRVRATTVLRRRSSRPTSCTPAAARAPVATLAGFGFGEVAARASTRRPRGPAARVRDVRGARRRRPRCRRRARSRARARPRGATWSSSRARARASPRCRRRSRCSTAGRATRRRRSASSWPTRARASARAVCVVVSDRLAPRRLLGARLARRWLGFFTRRRLYHRLTVFKFIYGWLASRASRSSSTNSTIAVGSRCARRARARACRRTVARGFAAWLVAGASLSSALPRCDAAAAASGDGAPAAARVWPIVRAGRACCGSTCREFARDAGIAASSRAQGLPVENCTAPLAVGGARRRVVVRHPAAARDLAVRFVFPNPRPRRATPCTRSRASPAARRRPRPSCDDDDDGGGGGDAPGSARARAGDRRHGRGRARATARAREGVGPPARARARLAAWVRARAPRARPPCRAHAERDYDRCCARRAAARARSSTLGSGRARRRAGRARDLARRRSRRGDHAADAREPDGRPAARARVICAIRPVRSWALGPTTAMAASDDDGAASGVERRRGGGGGGGRSPAADCADGRRRGVAERRPRRRRRRAAPARGDAARIGGRDGGRGSGRVVSSDRPRRAARVRARRTAGERRELVVVKLGSRARCGSPCGALRRACPRMCVAVCCAWTIGAGRRRSASEFDRALRRRRSRLPQRAGATKRERRIAAWQQRSERVARAAAAARTTPPRRGSTTRLPGPHVGSSGWRAEEGGRHARRAYSAGLQSIARRRLAPPLLTPPPPALEDALATLEGALLQRATRARNARAQTMGMTKGAADVHVHRRVTVAPDALDEWSDLPRCTTQPSTHAGADVLAEPGARPLRRIPRAAGHAPVPSERRGASPREGGERQRTRADARASRAHEQGQAPRATALELGACRRGLRQAGRIARESPAPRG